MISFLRHKATRVVAVSLGVLPAFASVPAGASPATWRISVRGQDVSRAADPRLEGGVLMVDAAALGPSLPLLVRAAGRQALIRDAAGADWQGAVGDSVLSSTGRSLFLERPVRIEGPSLYLPAKAVAELAGLVLDLDPGARTASFAAGRDGPPAEAPSGWQSLSLPKPAEPATAGAALPRRNQDILLPPDHDTLRVGLGLGAVPGADAGAELTASGSVRGIDTALSLLATTGPLGPVLLNSHVALTDPLRGLGFEGGDLFSGIWGLTHGARFHWRRGDGDDAYWPSLSIYTADPGVANPKTVIAYGDQIGLGRWGTAGGEIASDGSWLATEHFRQHGLSLFGYVRDASGSGIAGAGHGAGLSGSYDLPWGLELQGSLSRNGAGDQRLEDRNLSLRIPLRLGSDVTLAADRFAIGPTRGETDSVEGATAFGRLQLRGRAEWRETQFPGFLSTPAGSTAERDLLTAASYQVGTRLRIEGQLVERWPERNARNESRQVDASLVLARRTTLQVFATSSSSGIGNAYRVRLDQEIRPDFSFFVEAGAVITYQPVTGIADVDRNRLRIGLRHSWDLPTPSAGNGVEGFVASSGGLSPAGLGVELGPYRTVTDRDGHYAFPNAPPGDYELRLREQGLPADTTPGPAVRVRVKRGEMLDTSLSIAPLGEARGWVYVDRNGNHRRDADEGIGGIVVILDDSVTSTDADGSFGFFNLRPGSHVVHIETDRLPLGVEAVLPTRMLLGLPAGSSIETLEFRLQDKHKPVVFQETRK